MLDFLIVGAGLFGSTFARLAKDRGYKCLIIDKRDHIAGNCYTKEIDDIHVHMYGPHSFHTNNDAIWKFVNQFAEFNSFVTRTKVLHQGDIYSFPINLFTLHQVWGVTTPMQAYEKLREVKIDIPNPENLEEWCLSQIGEELYNIFIYGFTKKQWGKEPRELPSSIIKRLPIRLTHDDNFFNDKYQGIPIGGYTGMFKNMLDDIPVELGVDFFKNRDKWNAKRIVYTGPIDQFYDYEYGKLDYRSLRHENEVLQRESFQGNAIVNYTDLETEYTRIIEHKFFHKNIKTNSTIITREYPAEYTKENEPMYPISDSKNTERLSQYQKISKNPRYIFGGRLAEYRYYDMHQVIASALHKVEYGVF